MNNCTENMRMIIDNRCLGISGVATETIKRIKNNNNARITNIEAAITRRRTGKEQSVTGTSNSNKYEKETERKNKNFRTRKGSSKSKKKKKKIKKGNNMSN